MRIISFILGLALLGAGLAQGDTLTCSRASSAAGFSLDCVPFVAPPPGGDPAPPPPPAPPTPPATDGASFTWSQVGQVIQYPFNANAPVAFSYDVPIGYTGTLSHTILPLVGSAQDVHLRMWESETPGGPPVAGTLYDGPWIGGGIFGVGPFFPVPGRRYYVNVQVSATSRYGIEQIHS